MDDKRKQINYWGIVVSLVITVITAVTSIEIGLRLFYQLIPLDVCAADSIIGTYICQPYFEYDNPIRIGYRYTPGFRLEGMWDPANPNLASAGDETAPIGRSDAFPYVFETDDMGFPNPPGPWQDKYDIVIAGDSFTIRTAPKTWMELLGEQTGKDVLTLGAPSWSTMNQAEAIKRYGLDKNPEWVLVMFFEGNDIINIAQYLERKDSGLDWREYDLQNVPFYRRLITPHLITFFVEKLLPNPPIDPANYRYPVKASTEAGEIPTVLKDIHLLPLSVDYETLAKSDEYRAFKTAVLDLKVLTDAQDARLLFVYIPSKEHTLWSRIWNPEDVNNILERTVTVSLSEGDAGTLEWEPSILDYNTFNANHNAQERLISDFMSENEIEFLNLTPIFWQKSIEQGELYHYADPHWNQAGNQLAADAIQEYMETNE